MKVLLTGATGLAGAEALRQCVLDPNVERVFVLSRKPVSAESDKVEPIVHTDFTSYAGLESVLAASDACIFCLGIAQRLVSREAYERITFDFPVAAGRAILEANPRATFCFLSGQGADSAEKSRILFARVKGRAENALLAMSDRVFCFRPGFIRPVGPWPDGRSVLERAMGAIAPGVRKVFPGAAVDADELARAMLRVARDGAPSKILENRAIAELGRPTSGERA